MQSASISIPAADTRRARLALMGRLQDAEDDHDRRRCAQAEGAAAYLLERDKARWTSLGQALAALARQVSDAGAASPFSETRPAAEAVAVRLSEAIDDQLDDAAWRVMDAAARLAAFGG